MYKFSSVYTAVKSVLPVMVIGMLIGGCSDDPATKAAKQAHEQSVAAIKALNSFDSSGNPDFVQAQTLSKQAQVLARDAQGQADSAFIVAANVSSHQASKLQNGILLKQKPFEKAMATLQSLSFEYQDQQRQKEAVQLMIETSQAQIEEAKKLAYGENGIESMLQAKQDKLTSLQQQLDQAEELAMQMKSKSDQIQSQVDKLLRKAELSEGPEKYDLQKEAYAKVLDESGDGKLDWQRKFQETLDKSDLILSDINIVKPQVQKLTEDLAALKAKIEALQADPLKVKYESQIANLNVSLEKYSSMITASIDEATQAYKAYEDYIQEIKTYYEDAAEQFEKVKSKEIRSIANARAAAIRVKIANLTSSSMWFDDKLINRFEGLANISSQDFRSKFDLLANEFTSKADDLQKLAMQEYKDAIELFHDVAFSVGDDKLGGGIISEYMMNIYDAIKFADNVRADSSVIDQYKIKINEVKETLLQANPKFSQTMAGKLLSEYGVDFITEEDRLQTQYTELAQEFEDNSLFGDDFRRETFIELVEKLNSLKEPQDIEFFNNIIKGIYDRYSQDIELIRKEQPEKDIFDRFLNLMAAEAQGDIVESEDSYEE